MNPNNKKVVFSGKKFVSVLAVILSLLSSSNGIAQDTIRDLYNSEDGMHNGFYYSFWKDSGEATFGLRDGGRYVSEWRNVKNWLGGKGWNYDLRDRIVKYSGDFNISNSQNAYLALYGWTLEPEAEYYVIESYGFYNPTNCNSNNRQSYGRFESDGATYELVSCKIWNMLTIGDPFFYRYFSVRIPKKGFGEINGTITVANHFDAWESHGMALGKHQLMVFVTEAYQSTGSSDITIMDAAPPRNCGEVGGVPVCCNIKADPDGDGMGVQNNGQVCAVAENTEGWNPPQASRSSSDNSASSHQSSFYSSTSSNASATSSSNSSEVNSNTSGGSMGTVFILIMSGMLVLQRRFMGSK